MAQRRSPSRAKSTPGSKSQAAKSKANPVAKRAKKAVATPAPKTVRKPAAKAKRVAATKPTTKANPFKPGEMMTVKAKPASTRIRIVALKAYKDAL